MSVDPFRLWRQDDNGGIFPVADFTSRAAAEKEWDRLAAGGHKQIYWIEAPPIRPASLLTDIPEQLPEELFTTLLTRPGIRLERIVSRAHSTAAGQWYDQSWDEWVLLVAGSARLRFSDPEQLIDLRPGDHLLIPAHRRHRVEATATDEDTIWLALHLSDTIEPDPPSS
ncbi:hypothetical protein [Geothermobacter hydrogeniphilus]|uniref:hypothetical protein n=1 Tax=Geothermobacter hydrogeniphilus TaxID=1969733 RepID=UPI001E298E7B|nr:hypothetical protein [Geothermobacter hydrogeniphilus]